MNDEQPTQQPQIIQAPQPNYTPLIIGAVIMMVVGGFIFLALGDSTGCDYTPFTLQNDNLIQQNNQLNKRVSELGINNEQIKNTNNQLKLQIINQNKTDCPTTSCTTCTRLLTDCDIRLEDCWMNSNTTIINKTTTYFNETMYNMLSNCTTKLIDINKTLQ